MNDDGTLQCSVVGHVFDKASVVYRDGAIVTRCLTCDTRLTISPFKGNFTGRRLQALMQEALGVGTADAFMRLKEAVADFEVEVADSEGLLELARQALATLAHRV